jgi:hypothetical protein
MRADVPSGNRSDARVTERGAAVLVFVLLIGVAFICGGMFSARRQWRVAANWPVVDAGVTKSDVYRMRSRNGYVYRAEWEFRYIVEGKEYTTPLQSGITGSGYSSRKAEADQFSRGTRHQIRYDPSDPNRIEVRAGYTEGFFLLPIIFTATGIVVTAVSLWAWPKVRAQQPHPCPSCGMAIERSFYFCPRCAAKIPLRDRSDARSSEKPARKSDAKATIIVGAIFGALGLAALGFGSVLAVRQYRIITSWKRAESEVVKSQLVQSRGLRGLFHYNLKVQFRYAVDGREYVTESSLDDSVMGAGSNSYAFVRRIEANYAPGAHHAVLVSPQDPRQLHFEAGPTIYFFTAAAGVTAFGLIFAAVGFGLLIAMARSKTRPCLACGRMLQKQYRFCPKCAAPAG